MSRPWLTPALAVVVAVLGLAGSGLSALVTERQQDRHDAESLDRRAELIRRAVVAETRRYEDTLQDIAASINAQSELTAIDYAGITSALTRERLFGATGISLVVPAQPGQVGQVASFWRERGSTALELRPAWKRYAEHRFVVLSRTLDTSQPIVGLDISASPESVEAMNRAHATGRIAASDTYVLLRDRSIPMERRQLSFVITIGVRVDSPDGPVRGWLNMGLRGRDFLARTIQDVAQGQVEVTLIDVDRAEGRTSQVASWPPGREEDAAGLVRVMEVRVAQRSWRLRVYPTEDLLAGRVSHLPTYIAVAGLVITALLVGLVIVLATSRDRALAAVRRATAALEADIARREKVERRLRRSQEELRGFAGMAAHDLKAPLATASARLELVEDEAGALSERSRRDLGRAGAALHRMSALIGDLLSYATADQAPLRRQPVDLGEVAGEIAADRADLANGNRPHIEVRPLPVVEADPVMMRQLLDNLLSNAVKYAPPGRAAEVLVSAHRVGASCRIEVADRGIGVSAEQRETIFDAFRRAGGAEGYPGTGLGLAICARIVDRHGGEIGVRDNPGGGTVFWFTLPAAPP